MSEEIFALGAILSFLASAAALWSSIRRRQLMRRLLRSLDDAQLKELRTKILQNSDSSVVPAPDAPGTADQSIDVTLDPPGSIVAEALMRVAAALDAARGLLDEVYWTGLWSKSDDSSDNRRKRKGIREADWAVSGALRALVELRSHQPDVAAGVAALETELRVLVGVLEPLPDSVTDTMGESGVLDSKISEISRQISNLIEKAADLAEEYRGRQSETLLQGDA
jgi:hypothetical protein